MKLSLKTISTALAFALVAGASSSALANVEVELLARTQLSDNQDTDVIQVRSCAGGHKERVAAIQIKVTKDPARIDHLKITYGNGEKHNLNVRQYFAKGSTSRWIDMRGNLRCIRSIKVVGEAVGPAIGRQAVVSVFGVVVD